MGAGYYSFTRTTGRQIEQGSVWGAEFKAYTDAAKTTPRNLTGYTAKAQFRKSHDDQGVVADLATGNGITIIALEGRVAMALTPAQTKAMQAPHRGVWDLLLINGAGQPERFMEGDYEITPGVTKT